MPIHTMMDHVYSFCYVHLEHKAQETSELFQSRKENAKYGGRSLVESSVFKCLWGWVVNDGITCFLCWEKFAVDTFVLCKKKLKEK